jgi:hypothetical protein
MMTKTERVKLKVEEQVWSEDGDGFDYMRASHEYNIDLSKWPQFWIDNEFAAGYVEDIVKAAINGKTQCTESRKYTFHDMEDAYTPLFTEEPDDAFTQVLSIIVYINV